MKIGIYGYGNLGRGVEVGTKYNPDTELVGIFTRRDPNTVTPVFEDTRVYSADELDSFKEKIDVLIICGGSATDLPVTTPKLARDFNVVDSFDTHAKINEHFDKVDLSAKETNHIALISAGWDPGLFSLARIYANAALPEGSDYTFWGRGISQGHSDAIRRIEGVADARQYTVPKEAALQAVRNGECPHLMTADKHTRECYVVAKDGADKALIEKTIKEMPNYFADYDTTVNFISMEELRASHMGIPHGGTVIVSGKTGAENEHTHIVEYKLTLDSNPEFTASVICAYARAVARLAEKKDHGCKTVFDIAPAMLSPLSAEELRKTML
jgi:diaminopimelate dehydrogenase